METSAKVPYLYAQQQHYIHSHITRHCFSYFASLLTRLAIKTVDFWIQSHIDSELFKSIWFQNKMIPALEDLKHRLTHEYFYNITPNIVMS